MDLDRVDRWEDLPPGEWLDNDEYGNHWFKDKWGDYWCSDGESYYNYSKTSEQSTQDDNDHTVVTISNFKPSEIQEYFDDEYEETNVHQLAQLKSELQSLKKNRRKYAMYRIIALLSLVILLVVTSNLISPSGEETDLDCEQYNTPQQISDCEAAESRTDRGISEVQGIIIGVILIPAIIKYLKFESKFHEKSKNIKAEIKETKVEIKKLV